MFEEDASLLLWAYPRLLGWPYSVNWLFSPVTGNRKYPGDLWGLDSQGELLIVETKLDRAADRQDPFEDFVPYGYSRNAREFWSVQSLRPRWHRLALLEEDFRRHYARRFLSASRPTGTHPGILPYSSHRAVIWYWRALYRERIAPTVHDGRYRRAVERSLRVREVRGLQAAVFIGCVATAQSEDPGLSPRGERAFFNLRGHLGPDRVFLRAMRLHHDGRGYVRVHGWTPLLKRAA